MIRVALQRSGLGIILGLSFVVGSSTFASATECVCHGGFLCMPDPACFGAEPRLSVEQHDVAKDYGKALEKAVGDIGKSVEKLVILDTGYSPLSGFGVEQAGYGLYSYAILTSASDRSSAFLGEVFRSVYAIDDTAQRSQLNIFYLPTKAEANSDFANSAGKLTSQELGAKFTKSFYDYKIARSILNHICNPPADAIRDTCQGDLSNGPYIFTYAKPASSLEPVPPPFLFVDLTVVDPKAFGEYVSAFKAQVKREDISDGARINTLRLTLLNAAIKAGTLVEPIETAVKKIIHSSTN
jgi:hypothetical protein